MSVGEDVFALSGIVLDGRYAVERVVARGGFGLVYRARHLALGVPIALKVLLVPQALRGAENTVVERFRQEARTLASVRHPAIVRVLDVGTLHSPDGPRVWMALEWLDGVTLADDLRAREGQGRSPRETLALLDSALDAVQCAHARGVAHRDLKPANIMLTPTERGETSAHVLDFGIAKEFHPDELPGTGNTDTHGDFSAFSLDHAAPEQVGRARSGPWTDVHGLGLLVTELLLGRRPYPGVQSFDLCAAVMSPDRPTPGRFDLDVGPWEPVLQRALALQPSARFADAGALREALAATVDAAQTAWASNSAPASVAPPSVPAPTAPSQPASRDRRRSVVRAAALFVVVALLGLVGRLAPLTSASTASLARTPRPTVTQSLAPATPPPAVAAPPVAAPPVAALPATPSPAASAAPSSPRPRGLRAARPHVATDPDIVME